MEFIDLNKQYKNHKQKIDQAIQTVLDKSNYIMGDEVKLLEKKLAKYVGAKHCIACANGTDALTLSLMCIDVKKGDAVFVPSFTFFATAETVSYINATPIFVDSDPKTFNMDLDSLEAAIDAVKKEGILNLKAIMPADIFGQPVDYLRLEKIAKKYDMKIIEDGAQGFGGSINGKKVGSFGDLATTSFFPAKPLGCYGDGGAIFTDNDDYEKLLRSFAVHGKGSEKYDNIRIGMNSRLDTIQAAILNVKLNLFKDFELTRRNEIAQRYNEQLKKTVIIPEVPQDYYSSWAQYTIILPNQEVRTKLMEALKNKGIPSVIYYVTPLHLQTAYANHHNYVDLSNSETMANTVLSLPMHPYLTDEEVDFICDTIKEELK